MWCQDVKKSVKSPMVAGSAYSAWDCGTKQGRRRSASVAPARNSRDRLERKLRQADGPIAIRPLSVALAAASATSRSLGEKAPDVSAARMSRIWSPIATPPRKASCEPLRRKTPCGRFCIGKSLAPPLAESIQLARAGSCVKLRGMRVIVHVYNTRHEHTNTCHPMNELLNNPAVQAGVAPFLAALVVAASLRRGRLLGLAVISAFFVLVALTIGFSFEALTAQRKLVALAIVVAALVPLMELAPAPTRKHLNVAIAAAAAIAGVWAVLRVLQQREAGVISLAGAAAGLYLAALVTSAQRAGDEPVAAAASSFGLGLANGALALLGASALLAQMGIAIAAGAGAVLLVLTLGRQVKPGGWTLALPAAVTCGLIGLLAVFTGSLPWYCLLPVLGVPWAARLAPITGRPLWLGGALAVTAALVPALMAVTLAWFVTSA